MKKIGMISIVIFCLLGASASFAQKKSKKKGIKKQSLNFEDELVEGASKKPELFYLLQKKSFNYRRLIRLRKNFLPEMRRTSIEIQRAGRND